MPKARSKHPAILAALLLAAIMVVEAVAFAAAWTDRSGHRVSFVRVAPGISLEVLDWGGHGPPLILLAGLNNTAHVFDHFAHQFTARFRVLGVTRRGFGASSRPSSGYDTATLANDLLAVTDALKLDHVVFSGHSIAGDEMTKLAATHPEKVNALVYLDAAYDRTNEPTSGAGPVQPIADEDTASIERLEARFARVFGWRLPEGEILAQDVIASDGRVVRSTLSPDIAAQVLKGVERPAYDRIHKPALAIYALDDVHSTYPNFESFDAENKARAERQIAGLKPWQEASIAEFLREMEHGRVVALNACNHYLFLTNESEVVRLMQDFLSASK